MGFLPAGEPVPLAVQLPTEDGTQFCRATILDSSNSPIAGSPVSLPYISKGNYGSSSFLMPNTAWIKVIYEVFSDSGFTTLSPIYGESSDVIYLDTANGGGGGPLQSPRLIGIIGQTEDEIVQCSPCSKPFEIVQGSDVAFNVLFMDNDTKLPFDLTSVSSISAKFLNADGTFLTRNLSAGITLISPAVLGQIQIALTTLQTEAMQYGRVSMEITIVKAGSTHIVQFPYMLNVLQSVFT